MHVELDVFSGRPNPTWNLSQDEGRELTRLHRQLPAQAPPTSLPEGLGYRGFRVSGFQPFQELVVWKNTVTAARAEPPQQWHDANRSLEGFLLGTARAHVDTALFATVQGLVNEP